MHIISLFQRKQTKNKSFDVKTISIFIGYKMGKPLKYPTQSVLNENVVTGQKTALS